MSVERSPHPSRLAPKPAPDPTLDDSDNPEWTAADVDRAGPADVLPAAVLAAFPRTAARVRGPQKRAAKVATSIRLDLAVVAHFKASGPGWQTRINNALLDAIGGRRGG